MMRIYNTVRQVPKEAQKRIEAGRLKGKTDINPMWRIKALTEVFGPCGIGWRYEMTRQWLEVGANDEVSAFCNINLYIRYEGEWSEAIPGTGGSAFVAKERNGLYTSDECYKMALTDAISVACKALGMGADVYWEADRTKYSSRDSQPDNVTPITDTRYVCEDCGKPFAPLTDKNGKKWSAGQLYHMAEKNNSDGVARCAACRKKREAAINGQGI